jgi:hypothetical protein
MKGWIFTLFFIIAILVILKYAGYFFMELFSSEPNIKVKWQEEIIITIALAYSITYIIY